MDFNDAFLTIFQSINFLNIGNAPVYYAMSIIVALIFSKTHEVFFTVLVLCSTALLVISAISGNFADYWWIVQIFLVLIWMKYCFKK